MKRILFLGQKRVGQRCFDKLLTKLNKLIICGCVTNSSSNVWWGENKIWRSANDHAIKCIDNNKRNNHAILDLIEQENINTILSVQHPWILPKVAIDSVEGQAFNIHNAPLPQYQGYNACNHAILNGETQFCSTLHWMTDIVDAGAIVKEEWFPVDPDETALSLYNKGIIAAEKLFSFLLDCLTNGMPLPRKSITGNPMFYSRNSVDTLRNVDDLFNTDLIDRKSRAFYFPPFEPAFFYMESKKKYLFPKGAKPYLH